MVSDLVKAGLSRVIHLDGPASQPFHLAPPSILAVLTLVTTYQAAQEDRDSEHGTIFRETIQEWMGARLFNRLSRLPWPAVVNYAMAWALNARQNQPAPSQESTDTAGKTISQAIHDILAQDLDGRISDYASAYGLNPWEVVRSTPFDFFLAFVRHTDRVRGQAMIDHLTVRSLPYQEPADREAHLEAIYRMAGQQTEHGEWMARTKEERARIGLENLGKLEKLLRGG